MDFELKLVKVLLIERAESRGQTAKCPDKRELSCDLVSDPEEPRLLCKLKAAFGFTLHVRQRISRGKKICVEKVVAICSKSKVTDPVRGVESAPNERASGVDVSRPWHDTEPKTQIDASLIAMQSVLLHQIVA